MTNNNQRYQVCQALLVSILQMVHLESLPWLLIDDCPPFSSLLLWHLLWSSSQIW
jgi:hypothetical protein